MKKQAYLNKEEKIASIRKQAWNVCNENGKSRSDTCKQDGVKNKTLVVHWISFEAILPRNQENENKGNK